ncbi:hypothetical protein FRB93_012774 [Tulasnella sp. JGI-2019a]|nr:hypothetical protein FRB93_012774 [Tulasnella sp. JGI-2019a]
MSSSRPPTPFEVPLSKWTKSIPPGVNDVRNKVCWICREEEGAEASSPRRTWIHPCDCTLVAHESCLLTWIRLQEPSPSKPDALKCPQCKTPFDIKAREPRILKVLEMLNNGVTRTARWSALIVVSGSVLGLSALYGSFAVRCFLGDKMADVVLGGRYPRQWRLNAWLNLPLIPYALTLNSVGFIPTIAPFLIAPISVMPTMAWRRHASSPAESIKEYLYASYPPSPLLLCAMWPLVQLAYRRAFRALVSRLVATRKSSSRPRRPGRQNSGLNPADAEMGEVAEGAEALGDPDRDFRAGLERGDTITLTGGTLSRIFIGSLILPPISKLMGELLRQLSKRSEMLQAVLGIRNEVFPGLYGDRMEDLDPVWWRNVIGLSVFIVGRDVLDLWRRYLRVQEKRSRKVVSKPFTHVDYTELDLIV